MPGFFMLSIKQKLKTYILPNISSKVTTLLGVTNYLGVTTLKTAFASGLTISPCLDVGYLNNLASVSPLINVSNMLTYLWDFLDYLQLGLFGMKSINVENTCTRGTCIGDTYTEDVYIGRACTESICVSGSFEY